MGDRHLFIGNLCHVSIESLRTYCEKYGSVMDLSLNRDKDNNIYHCFAFVTYQSVRSVTQFMLKRPHSINGEQIFVKRALSRLMASIPERLVVTNRLVIAHPKRLEKKSLRHYFQKFGQIRNFDYENGWMDFDDYDDVDRILLGRPHFIHEKEIFVTKIIPNREESNSTIFDDGEDENFKIKYRQLENQFREYREQKEKELNILKKELEELKEELSDITQIKLDKLIKNQQIFHNQLLLRLFPESDAIHAQMCEDFLRSSITPKKKRKTTSLVDYE